jgi:hypothetical protein
VELGHDPGGALVANAVEGFKTFLGEMSAESAWDERERGQPYFEELGLVERVS